MNFSRAVGVSDCFSYCTLQCWKMVPGGRPTFTELYLKLSSLIEQTADYLQMGYNPFIVGGGKGGEEEEEEEEKVNEEEEKEVGVINYRLKIICIHC